MKQGLGIRGQGSGAGDLEIRGQRPEVRDRVVQSKIENRKSKIRDLSRLGQFLLVGLSGTLVNLAGLWLLVELGMPHFWAALVATELAIINNFVWNDRWTFQGQSDLSLWKRFSRFQLVTSGTAALTLGLFSLLSGPAHLHYLVAQAIAIGLSTILNFIFNSRFTWSQPMPREGLAE